MASNSTSSAPTKGSGATGDDVVVTVDDIRRLGIANLDPIPEDYYDSGADQEQTLRENRLAYLRLRLRPKQLNNVATREKAVTLLKDQKLSMPIGIAPTAFQKMAHPDGEMATARAAQKANTLMILSTLSNTTMEDVAAAAPGGLRWFQLYVYKDRDITKDLVKRAENSGYKALVVTVDTPLFGNRIADVKNNFTLPDGLTVANLEGVGGSLDPSSGSGLAAYGEKLLDPSLTWNDIKWLRSITNLKVIAKGVLTAEDARNAVNSGVSGILVSNHGARQLDGVTSTIEALPEIIRAVRGRVEVYLDGGIRHGTDAIKALALGAKAVFVGRPALWGLAYNGEDGVTQMLEILRKELDLGMALIGAPKIAELRPEMVARQETYARL
ncbi:hydroxyacid oxidase 1 [Ixodes scapularis]|uniref:hydroxyacid oxidase 1 n=1 Tax=Ixodes scapularis TaxID=6945 RepID=UPI001A9D737C|nr:hydroxyacid oxidase 1 [Ixodes scapularis]